MSNLLMFKSFNFRVTLDSFFFGKIEFLSDIFDVEEFSISLLLNNFRTLMSLISRTILEISLKNYVVAF